MEAFCKDIADLRLKRGLAEWRSYESSIAALVKQPLRSTPHIRTGGTTKGSPEIAERLMCAVLIIRKLHPM